MDLDQLFDMEFGEEWKHQDLGVAREDGVTDTGTPPPPPAPSEDPSLYQQGPIEYEQYEPQYEDDEEVGEDQMEDQGDAMDDGVEEAEAAGLGPGSYSNKEREEAERRASIMASMSDLQLDRYEAFRRSSLARPKMKQLLQTLLGGRVMDKAIIALCGIGKMFVGDVIEMARHLAGNEGHTGPLLPRHIRRAYQQLELADKGPPRKQPRKRMFKS